MSSLHSLIFPKKIQVFNIYFSEEVEFMAKTTPPDYVSNSTKNANYYVREFPLFLKQYHSSSNQTSVSALAKNTVNYIVSLILKIIGYLKS